jgi:tetratricopeptide (TPR) repeat protein
MSDDNTGKTGLGVFLTRFSTPIAATLAFITSIYGFIKLFADKDVGLIAQISLTVGIFLFWGICLYYARLWKPEEKDKGLSAFAPAPTDKQVKAQAKKEKRRKVVRRSAIAGLILIPLLTVAGIAGWSYVQNLPTKDVVILIADFDGPDPQNYRVTSTIYGNLQEATKPYKDVKVKLLGKAIKEQEGSEVAREEGKKQKASILIWGWYGKTKDISPFSVNFELLKPPEHFSDYVPELGAEARGKVRTAPIAELESFKVQPRLSGEMAYLTLVTLGMSRYATEDWDGAIAAFSDALKQVKEPVSALTQDAVYNYRGISFYYKKDYGRAIADYTQTIKLKPEFADAYANRGLAYYHKKDYDRAILDFNQAIKLKPDYADAYFLRGNAYSDKKDYDRAILDFNQTIKLQPNAADAYDLRGNAYSDKKDYDRAILDYTQVIKLKPDYAAAVYNLRGGAYFDKKDYDRAILDFNQAIKLKSDYADAYFSRGAAYSDKKDYDRAILDFNQAIEFKPNFTVAYFSRGVAYSDKEDYDRAILDFNQAIKLQPGTVAYYNRGNAYLDKDYDRAILDFNRAIKLKPDYADAYFLRGIAHGYKKDYDRAILDYTQVIKLQPDAADAYIFRGKAFLNKGDKKSAIRDFKKVLELTKEQDLRKNAEQELKKLGMQ